jgi:hypothetical protein
MHDNSVHPLAPGRTEAACSSCATTCVNVRLNECVHVCERAHKQRLLPSSVAACLHLSHACCFAIFISWSKARASMYQTEGLPAGREAAAMPPRHATDMFADAAFGLPAA